jgi:hypothetical protein
MTWGEFKRAMDAEGVGDEEDIFYIDIHMPSGIDVGRVDRLGIVVSSGF